MKKLLLALGAMAALFAPAVLASRADEAAIAAPAAAPTGVDDATLNAQAWVGVRHHWAWRYHRRQWPPECVVGWEHFYWWGHRYSCYHPVIRRHVRLDRRATPN
jgi:hypothetical protein